MAEFSDAGASVPHVPEVQLGAVNGELAAATQNAGKPSADSMGFNAAFGAAVSMFLGPVGVAISMAMSLRDGMSGSSNQKSQFLGTHTKQKPPAVDFAKLMVAGHTLTGINTAGSLSVPAQGVKVSSASVSHYQYLNKLRLEKANMQRAIDNRFEGTSGTNRLRQEFNQGGAKAKEVAAQKNPSLKLLVAPVKTATPRQQLKQSQFVLAG